MGVLRFYRTALFRSGIYISSYAWVIYFIGKGFHVSAGNTIGLSDWILITILLSPFACALATAAWFGASYRVLRTLPLRFEHLGWAAWFAFVVLGPFLQTVAVSIGSWVSVTSPSTGGALPMVALGRLLLIFMGMHGTCFLLITLAENLFLRIAIALGVFVAFIYLYVPITPWVHTFRWLPLWSGAAIVLSYLRKSHVFVNSNERHSPWLVGTTAAELHDGAASDQPLHIPPPMHELQDEIAFLRSTYVAEDSLAAKLGPGKMEHSKKPAVSPYLLLRHPLFRRLPWYGLCGLVIGMFYANLFANMPSLKDEHPMHSSGCASLLAILVAIIGYMIEKDRWEIYRTLPIPKFTRCVFLISIGAITSVCTFLGCSPWLSTTWQQSAPQQFHALLFAIGVTSFVGTISYAGLARKTTRKRSLARRVFDLLTGLFSIQVIVASIPLSLNPVAAQSVTPIAGPVLGALSVAVLLDEVYRSRSM